MNNEPQFRLGVESDAGTLLRFMREYYAFDGHGFDEPKALVALVALMRDPNLGRAWLILKMDRTGFFQTAGTHGALTDRPVARWANSGRLTSKESQTAKAATEKTKAAEKNWEAGTSSDMLFEIFTLG